MHLKQETALAGRLLVLSIFEVYKTRSKPERVVVVVTVVVNPINFITL